MNHYLRIPLGALTAALLASPALAFSLQEQEAWRAEISMDADTQTQAVESDSVGNSFVAGVSNTGAAYQRFLLKLDGDGGEVWRFESGYTSANAGIAHQQIVVDEADDALYVLRSNVNSASFHVISVAKHSLIDGSSIWNTSGGLASVPLEVGKSAALGLGSGGIVWVARQFQTNFPPAPLRWSIQYKKLDAATGVELGDSILAASSGTDRFLYDMAAEDDRLFVAYREEGPANFDLVVTAYDIGGGSLVIINPHLPAPCSKLEPCRQERTFSIPASTNGTATFTDARFDERGNFAVAGYYEHLELEDNCYPRCDDLYVYYPVVVKVDRANQMVFETIEPVGAQKGWNAGSSPPQNVSTSIAAAGGGFLSVLVGGDGGSGLLLEQSPDGVALSSWLVHQPGIGPLTPAGCPEQLNIWHPGFLTAAPGNRRIVTGQVVGHCTSSTVLDTSRTVSFAMPSDLEWDGDRLGSDYAGFWMTSANPLECRAACIDDPPCLAFTYVEPGIQGSDAVCYLKDAVPNRSALQGAVSGIVRSGLEMDVNRQGGDFSSFITSDAEACRDACIADDNCLSYTHRTATDSRCFLKNVTPSPVRKTGLTSGFVRDPNTGLEYSVDRLGGGYTSLWLDDPNPRLCQAACTSDTLCLAFTYVEPGVQGTQARCWLKRSVPAPRFMEGVVSGTL